MTHTWHTLSRGGGAMLFALLLITLSVAAAATAVTVMTAMQQMSARVERSIAAVVFLNVDSTAEAHEVHARMRALPSVGDTTLTSPADALERATRTMGKGGAGWEGMRMPWVIEVAHHDQAVGSDRQALVTTLMAVPGVQEVVLPAQELDRFDRLLRVIATIGWVVAILFVIVIIVVVSNAVRLAMLLRQEELVVQQLLGASPSFLVGPLVGAGAVVGLLGGILGVLVFWGGSRALTAVMVEFGVVEHAAIPTATAVALVIGAVLLGALAAGWSARAVLRMTR
jgi:cell division transport system permease protein